MMNLRVDKNDKDFILFDNVNAIKSNIMFAKKPFSNRHFTILKNETMINILAAMPYSKKWSDKVWKGLERTMRRDHNKEFIIYRVDHKPILAENLGEHIEYINKQADILIADLTEANKNVLLEVGIGLGCKKPIILISQHKKKWTPSHLGGRIMLNYNPNDDKKFDRFITDLYSTIKDRIELINIEKKQIDSKEEYYIQCYSKRKQIIFKDYFRKAENRIDILTTNLSFLLEKDYEGNCLFDHICYNLNKKKSKTKVRILTLDPESDFAAKRGKQLGYLPAVFRDNLRKALKDSEAIKSRNKYSDKIFESRTYQDFPNQISYRIDDHVFSCVVAQPTASRNHITFHLRTNQQGVDNSFINHF